jgi:P27 family predicted phage terminase small subunit
MQQVVTIDKMKVGAKGGGKHWTKKEIAKRKVASKKFERQSKVKLTIPVWLDGLARDVWEKTIKNMQGLNILDDIDEDCLATYCDAVARHQEATLKIREEGYTITTQMGIKESPYVKMSQSYARIIMMYADKLGLNPNSRARLIKKMADEIEDPNTGMFGD